MCEDIDPKKLTLPLVSKHVYKDNKTLPRHKKGEKFLKGPIPWDWLSMASKQPGKALHIGNALWFIAGIKNERTIALSGKIIKDMGIKRNAAYRGLTALEEVGLISVSRHRGRCPVITINKVKDAEHRIPVATKQTSNGNQMRIFAV